MNVLWPPGRQRKKESLSCPLDILASNLGSPVPKRGPCFHKRLYPQRRIDFYQTGGALCPGVTDTAETGRLTWLQSILFAKMLLKYKTGA